MTDRKAYLGDGAYVDFDGYHIVLTTENGIEETNRICLEPEVLVALDRYRAKLKADLAALRPKVRT